MTLQIFGGTGGCEKYFLSKDTVFLDEAFGNEREIVREPSVNAAFERADPDDSFSSQQRPCENSSALPHCAARDAWP